MSTTDPIVRIVEFTDPGCPFAFSAEPHRLRLRWLFGDQLEWKLRMVGLAGTRQDNTDKGLDPEMIAEQAEGLVARFGMPLFTGIREAVPATLPACRAIVAVRLHAPELEWAFLRCLRVRAMGGGMLDDPKLIDRAAADVAIAADDLRGRTAGQEVAAELSEDLRLARNPTPEALALPSKLASTPDGMRYSTPAYVLSASGRSYTVPGIQSSLAYETALANLAPQLERRPEPEDVGEVLRWAGYPLATQEVAEVCSTTHNQAHERLVAAGGAAHTGRHRRLLAPMSAFLDLHHRAGAPLLVANPWDRGSARLLESLGFEALATTSSGFAASLGRLDYAISRDDTLAYAQAIVESVAVPVTADLEDGFADGPEGVAETIRLATRIGLAGGSIEDTSRRPEAPIHPFETAVARIEAAVEAARAAERPFVLTARAENILHGHANLADTIARLQAFEEAGADVLFAPGVTDLDEIREIVSSVSRPVNVLVRADSPKVAELADAGVRRISVGGAFAFAALGAVTAAARELLDCGTYGFSEQSRDGLRAAGTAFAEPSG